MSNSRRKPEVLVFDVNETLLDLAALQPEFERLFGEASAVKDWFALLLQYSLVVTTTERYVDFGALGKSTLRMLAQARKTPLSKKDADRVIQAMESLPAHPEVPAALNRLRKAGFRMAALSNSSPSMLQAQLKNSKLACFFDPVISVEEVKRFKPHPAVYAHAARRLGIPPSAACLVAAHAWDVYGAMSAGWSAALVTRRGQAPFPFGGAPAFTAPDLKGIANLLV